MNIASERTKKVLAKVLISLMEERDFPKITIADVVNKAGINRKTFYYVLRKIPLHKPAPPARTSVLADARTTMAIR